MYNMAKIKIKGKNNLGNDYDAIARKGKSYQRKVITLLLILAAIIIVATYIYLESLEVKIIERLEDEGLHVEYSSDGIKVTPEKGNKQCFDTDERNYYLKGNVMVDSSLAYTDKCLDSNTVREAYCYEDDVKFITFHCPEGCKDGACI